MKKRNDGSGAALIEAAKKVKPGRAKNRLTRDEARSIFEVSMAYIAGEISGMQGAAVCAKKNRQRFQQLVGSVLIRAVQEGWLVTPERGANP